MSWTLFYFSNPRTLRKQRWTAVWITMILGTVLGMDHVKVTYQHKSTATVISEKCSQDIKVWQIWMTETRIRCVRGNVSVPNFRLCATQQRRPPDLHNAACRGSRSISVSAGIHGCHNNLQETQEVSMSVYHLIINRRQYNTFFWYLLTCVNNTFLMLCWCSKNFLQRRKRLKLS